MTGARLSLTMKIALAAMFMCVQATGLSHAASYGDHPHEHGDIACSLDAVAEDEDVFLPAPPAPDDIGVPSDAAPARITAPNHSFWPPGRAPPPRSPPTS